MFPKIYTSGEIRGIQYIAESKEKKNSKCIRWFGVDSINLIFTLCGPVYIIEKHIVFFEIDQFQWLFVH